MKVLLVNPPRFHGIPVIREERCEITERNSIIPPYSLLQIASRLRVEGHEVQLIDANGENLSWAELDRRIGDIPCNVLIFRFTPTTLSWDVKTASLSKKNNPWALTVGICWTLRTNPLKVMQNAIYLDVYIVHEYETVAPSLVSAVSEGRDLSTVSGIAYRHGDEIKINKLAEPLSNWDSLPLPAYDLLPSLETYFVNTPHGSPFTILYASKGCPFSCIYCTERNTKLKNRSAERILKELRYLRRNFGVKTVSFFDESFTIDRERTITLSETIRKERLDIVWYCNTRVDLVDKSLLKIMFDGGCRGISFGVESGSQRILDNAKKGIATGQAADAIATAKKTGIKVFCSFIFGLPGENWSSIYETIDFVKRTLPTGAQFNVAVPYPGTELHRIAVDKGWLQENVDSSAMYQHKAVMRTDELTSADLDKARRLAYRVLYFNPKWWVQNAWHTIRYPEDFQLASKYATKILKNYVIHKMVHAH